jgi:hypothetical protein
MGGSVREPVVKGVSKTAYSFVIVDDLFCTLSVSRKQALGGLKKKKACMAGPCQLVTQRIHLALPRTKSLAPASISGSISQSNSEVAGYGTLFVSKHSTSGGMFI